MKHIQPLLLLPLFATLGACQMVSDADLAKRTDTLTDADGDGFTSTEYGGDDCDDDNEAINPDSTETPYDGVDDDCSGADLTDVDGDGHDAEAVGGNDCDDDNEAINPDSDETPYDGVDDDCSGADLTDVDGDGHDAEAVGGSDCDDDNEAINPDSDEVCDEVDNNCNDAIDEAEALDASVWYADDDGDDFGDPDTSLMSCSAPDEYVADNTDCNDDSDAAYPGGMEVCGDGLDNDCNDAIDEDAAMDAPTWYADDDGDDFGDPDTSLMSCSAPDGYVADNTDCDDDDDEIHPDATEICGDDIDNDCNDEVDGPEAVDAVAWYLDGDRDDFGDPDSSLVLCDAPDGYVANNNDCDDDDDDIFPGAIETLGDETDSDCNGDDDGFSFHEIVVDEDVLQGPVLTRHGSSADEKIRIAWTTEECDREESREHDCVFVETRSADEIHLPAPGHRAIDSNAEDLGEEINGFDFVSNETYWGWARAIRDHDGIMMELAGHNSSTGTTDKIYYHALLRATEEWSDLDAGLNSLGTFSAVACSNATSSSPGSLAVLLRLEDLAEHTMEWSYQDLVANNFGVCAWDPYWAYFHFLKGSPSYSWDRWRFTFPIYDTLTFWDIFGGVPMVDLEMKVDHNYFGRVFSVDTDAWPSGSDMYVDFYEIETDTWFDFTLSLEHRPTEIDMAFAQDTRVLICSMTEDGAPHVLLIDPLGFEDIVAEVALGGEVLNAEDCSVAINQDNEALIVYRSDDTLYEGRVALP